VAIRVGDVKEKLEELPAAGIQQMRDLETN
jgi:hypothetical protein